MVNCVPKAPVDLVEIVVWCGDKKKEEEEEEDINKIIIKEEEG